MPLRRSAPSGGRPAAPPLRWPDTARRPGPGRSEAAFRGRTELRWHADAVEGADAREEPVVIMGAGPGGGGGLEVARTGSNQTLVDRCCHIFST